MYIWRTKTKQWYFYSCCTVVNFFNPISCENLANSSRESLIFRFSYIHRSYELCDLVRGSAKFA